MSLKKAVNILVNIGFYSCLLVLLWVVMQVCCFTSFSIPSVSMDPTLIPGDNILVNKIAGGARLFDVLASLEKEEVNIYRVPGTTSFKRNDVLVFNFPYPAQWDSIGFDVMTYYVKRCVGLPGDTIAIRNGYFTLSGTDMEVGNPDMQAFVSMLPDSATQGIEMNTYPWDAAMGWTIKEFGPLPIPQKGQEVQMDKRAWLLYRTLIFWEQKQRLTLDGEQVYLGDSLISSYRFKENYYFMAGDKLIDSQDSRYWGLLPEEFIVGRADYVWMSKDKHTGKRRWDRFMKRIQ